VRPRYSAMQSERGLTLASLQDAVEQYLAEVEPVASYQSEFDEISRPDQKSPTSVSAKQLGVGSFACPAAALGFRRRA